MIDLFGLGKNQDPQQPQESSPAPEPAAVEAPPRGSHKLWAFLLVLDSVFVVVFAGAVAAKVYQHWKTPALAAPVPRKRFVKAVEAPVASTAPAPTPVPEPVKPPEPPKPVAAKPAAEAPRPPKPSMLADAPKHRETPKPADAVGKPVSAPKPAAAAPAPAPVAADGKIKALKTEFKIHAPKAKAVELVGAFIVRGGRKDMTRQDDGSWTVTLYLNPGSYRYFFSVDKKKQLDPENPHSEKGASLLSIP